MILKTLEKGELWVDGNYFAVIFIELKTTYRKTNMEKLIIYLQK